MKKKETFFGLVLILVISFISIDLFTLIKVKNLRIEKTINNSLIEEAVDIQNRWFVQVSKMNGYNLNEDFKGTEQFDFRGRNLENKIFIKKLDLRLNELILTKSESSILALHPIVLKKFYNDILFESHSVIKAMNDLNYKINEEIDLYLFNTSTLAFITFIFVLIVVLMRLAQLKLGYNFFKTVEIHNLLLKNSTDFILTTNKRTEIVEFNEAAQKAFGYTQEEVKKSKREILFNDPADAAILTKILNETGEFKGEIINKRKNGEIFTSYLSANTIYNTKGAKVGTMGISRDITNEKKVLLLLENQSKEIRHSITYASRFQKAMLPSAEYIDRVFPESFVFYKPIESLGGDFYLIKNILSKSGVELQFLIVADCTGHGVPGAILSILCNSLIKESLMPGICNSPAEMLVFVRSRIIEFFHSNEDNDLNIFDGMDASICMFDKKNQQVHFSGANNICFFIRNNEIKELISAKQSVSHSHIYTPFFTEIIDTQLGDCFYLCTDGFIDQFGGDQNKKYMKKRLKELLLSNHKEKMSVQGEKLENAFNDWKQANDQTDDVLVFGLKCLN
jgi:PAS domain S-box-containing protein